MVILHKIACGQAEFCSAVYVPLFPIALCGPAGGLWEAARGNGHLAGWDGSEADWGGAFFWNEHLCQNATTSGTHIFRQMSLVYQSYIETSKDLSALNDASADL